MSSIAEDERRLTEEVAALEAIYGDDAVSFYHPTRALAVRFSDNLGTFSCILPPGYPSSARPKTPTLRSDFLSASAASAVVATALADQESSPPSGDGDECLFDYCQAIVDAASSAKASAQIDEERNEALAICNSTEAHSTTSKFACPTFHGEPLIDRKSTFQAHAAHVSCVEDAMAFVRYVNGFGKVASATHNVMAYRIGAAQDCDDDGEHGAGKGLLFTLQQAGADNVVIVVSRWFGGIKLGPVRFKHINNVARNLITAHPSQPDAS